MIKVGNSPYLECSSKGCKAFSAFYAKVRGRSIEERYQEAKIFTDGTTGLGWKEAKGKTPVNIEEVSKMYKDLWREYLKTNPNLLEFLKNQPGLSDVYGQKGHNCQATTLWELREEI